jgi:hypothetical protein
LVGACGPGGIQSLREIAEAHPTEFVYELHLLGYTPEDIGRRVDHVIADHLIRIRMREPDSWLFAAAREWAFPVSREWMLAADHYDAFTRANSGRRKPKPYPRPWKDQQTKKLGTTNLSPVDARDLLRRAAREGVGTERQ